MDHAALGERGRLRGERGEALLSEGLHGGQDEQMKGGLGLARVEGAQEVRGEEARVARDQRIARGQLKRVGCRHKNLSEGLSARRARR